MEKILGFLNGHLGTIGLDKYMHFIGGTILFAVFHFLMTPMLALVGVLLLGIAKELYDRANKAVHTPDYKDALATALGGVLGFICGM